MKFLSVIAIAALVSCACGESDVDCVRRITAKCNTDVWSDPDVISNQDSYCKTYPKYANCLKEGFSECNQAEMEKEADKTIKTFSEACKEGTHLNDELKKHEACIMVTSRTSVECLKDFMELIEKMKEPTAEELANLHKELCKRIDTIKECGYDQVRAKCGADAEALFRSLNEPAVHLNKMMCEVLDSQLYMSRMLI